MKLTILEILIIDNGTGFKNTYLSEVTKPYFTTKKNGSGLGLSIVVKIINDHNGTIDFSNYKNGAKIKLTFPKLMTAEILIIDDNPDIRNIIRDLINEWLQDKLLQIIIKH